MQFGNDHAFLIIFFILFSISNTFLYEVFEFDVAFLLVIIAALSYLYLIFMAKDCDLAEITRLFVVDAYLKYSSLKIPTVCVSFAFLVDN